MRFDLTFLSLFQPRAEMGKSPLNAGTEGFQALFESATGEGLGQAPLFGEPAVAPPAPAQPETGSVPLMPADEGAGDVIDPTLPGAPTDALIATPGQPSPEPPASPAEPVAFTATPEPQVPVTPGTRSAVTPALVETTPGPQVVDQVPPSREPGSSAAAQALPEPLGARPITAPSGDPGLLSTFAEAGFRVTEAGPPLAAASSPPPVATASATPFQTYPLDARTVAPAGFTPQAWVAEPPGIPDASSAARPAPTFVSPTTVEPSPVLANAAEIPRVAVRHAGNAPVVTPDAPIPTATFATPDAPSPTATFAKPDTTIDTATFAKPNVPVDTATFTKPNAPVDTATFTKPDAAIDTAAFAKPNTPVDTAAVARPDAPIFTAAAAVARTTHPKPSPTTAGATSRLESALSATTVSTGSPKAPVTVTVEPAAPVISTPSGTLNTVVPETSPVKASPNVPAESPNAPSAQPQETAATVQARPSAPAQERAEGIQRPEVRVAATVERADAPAPAPDTGFRTQPGAARPAESPLPWRAELLAQSIASQARRLAPNVPLQLRFALQPEELGTVHIRMQISGEQLRVELVTTNSGATGALNAGVPRLVQHLQAAGFSEAEVSLALDSTGDSEAHARQDGQREAAHGRSRHATLEREPLTWNDDRATPSPRTERGRLNRIA